MNGLHMRATIKHDPTRPGRAREEAAKGNIRIRLNAQQTADLTAASVDDALRPEMEAALSSRRYYWDDTSVLFVSPPLAAALYAASFNLGKGSHAHRVGSRALRKQINEQIDPPIADLEVGAHAEEANPAYSPSGPEVGLWIGGFSGGRYVVEVDRDGRGTVTTVTVRLCDPVPGDRDLDRR